MIKHHLVFLYYHTYVGDDYESGPFNVTIPAGEINVPFNVLLTDDIIFESHELFSLTIDPSSLPSAVFLQSDCMLTVLIIDDDFGELHIGYTYIHK